MKDKQLTPLQKTRATQREVKKYIKEVLEPKMFKDIENVFKRPLHANRFNEQNEDIKNYIIDKHINK